MHAVGCAHYRAIQRPAGQQAQLPPLQTQQVVAQNAPQAQPTQAQQDRIGTLQLELEAARERTIQSSRASGRITQSTAIASQVGRRRARQNGITNESMARGQLVEAERLLTAYLGSEQAENRKWERGIPAEALERLRQQAFTQAQLIENARHQEAAGVRARGEAHFQAYAQARAQALQERQAGTAVQAEEQERRRIEEEEEREAAVLRQRAQGLLSAGLRRMFGYQG